MNRDKNLPLTETTYYVLLALLEPGSWIFNYAKGGGIK